MNTFSSKLYTFSWGFIRILSLLLTAALFAGGFLFTCYSENMETQQVLTKWDNPLWGLLGIAVFLAVFFGVSKALKKLLPDSLQNKFLLLFVLAWCLLAGGLLILFSKTVPAADAMSVYSAAELLAAGDVSVIHPTDSYLSYYPQQIGLVAFYEIIIRFLNLFPTGLPAYHFIKCLYVLLACVIVFFQYKTVHLIWKDRTADRLCLLLMGASLPFLMYTSFVYGEIPSFAAISAGFYCLLKLLESHRASGKGERLRVISYGAGAILLLTLSVMLRKNSLILVIAALLVLFFQWLKTKRHFLLLLALLCGISCFNVLALVQKGYELRSGSSLSSGVPAMNYFAMGMQESTRGNGWYNGFNFDTYRQSGMDSQAAAAISKDAISKRLAYFGAYPGYAADFYLKKHLSQWADGTYACRQATLATFGGRREFFNSLYAGDYSYLFIHYCNAWQNVLYLGVLLFCLWMLPSDQKVQKEETEASLSGLPVYLGMIGVVGGFLFHIVWEANSRYIFLYGLLLIPYAAKGISLLFTLLLKSRVISQDPPS